VHAWVIVCLPLNASKCCVPDALRIPGADTRRVRSQNDSFDKQDVHRDGGAACHATSVQQQHHEQHPAHTSGTAHGGARYGTSIESSAIQQQRRVLDGGNGYQHARQGSASPSSSANNTPRAAARMPRARAGSEAKEMPKAGVGLFFVQSDGGTCEVDEIIQGSSAHADGRIAVGDVLLAVDGQSVVGKDLGQARDMIVGPPDTEVALTFLRVLDCDNIPGSASPPSTKAEERSLELTVSLVRSLKRTPGSDAPPAAIPSYLNSSAAPAHTGHSAGKPPLSGGVGLSAHASARAGAAAGEPRVGGFSAVRLTHVDAEMSAQSFTTDFSRDNPSERGVSRQSSMRSVQSYGGDVSGAGGGQNCRSYQSPGAGALASGTEEMRRSGSRGSAASASGTGSESVLAVRAICSFVAQKAHELSFDEGEVMVILRKHQSGWWDGYVSVRVCARECVDVCVYVSVWLWHACLMTSRASMLR
jgi:hypothetical protein